MYYSPYQAAWGLGALIGSLVIYACLFSDASTGMKTTGENFDKVQSGMSIEEVTRLLGWSYRENRSATAVTSDHGEGGQYELIWKTDKGEIHVVFMNDRVFSKYKR